MFLKNKDLYSVNTRHKNKLAINKLILKKTSKCIIGTSIQFYNKISEEITSLNKKNKEVY